MKNVTFYLLNNNAHKDDLAAIEELTCEIAANCWRNGKCILIACEDKKQAIRIDNALWIYPKESFIPHNLSGEGPKNGAPIEIDWLQKKNNKERDVLINLDVAFLNFANDFIEIVDFVPCKEFLKKLARERYKAYRLAGFNLNTKQL